MNERLDYIDSLTTIFVKEQLISNIEFLSDELREEGFFDEDIYDYLSTLVLYVLNSDSIDKIKVLLSKEKKS